MGKLSKEEIDKIVKQMRDSTMDRLEEMKNPFKLNDEDVENIAKSLFLLYSAFVSAGFSKAQAMDLIKTVLAMGAKITK